MDTVLRRDADWAKVEGLICEVQRFTPFAPVQGGKVLSGRQLGTYGLVAIQCREQGHRLPPDTIAAITHKEDYKHLWAVFQERGVCEDEVVIIVWQKGQLRGLPKLLAPFMPRLAVMVLTRRGYELLHNKDAEPGLGGEARYLAMKPVASWTPEVFK